LIGKVGDHFVGDAIGVAPDAGRIHPHRAVEAPKLLTGRRSRRRPPQDRPGDPELSADIRRLVDQRPTYGYRRIAALLKRERRSDGLAPINTKRVYRLIKKHGLLLERHTGRR
jgi:hypothetical protein